MLGSEFDKWLTKLIPYLESLFFLCLLILYKYYFRIVIYLRAGNQFGKINWMLAVEFIVL